MFHHHKKFHGGVFFQGSFADFSCVYMHRIFCVYKRIMQDIIREYGPAIISVVVIGAMIALVTFLIGNDNSSIVGQAFETLINNFFAGASGGGAG